MSASDFWIRGLLGLGDLHRRLLSVALSAAGPGLAYPLTALGARALYGLLPPLRQHAESQCRAALPHLEPERVREIAACSVVHRIWGIIDLLVAERWLHPGTWQRYGGRLAPPLLAEMLDAQRRGQPALLLTAYFGAFDLLPAFLGYQGIRASAVYLAHANPAFDALRRRVRMRGGWGLVPTADALVKIPRILDAGGTVAVLADHPGGRHGMPATFLGRPVTVHRTVGLLAARHAADVVVAGLKRVADTFRFELNVVDVIRHREWQDEPDPVQFITTRYLAAVERLIRGAPDQYLWASARW